MKLFDRLPIEEQVTEKDIDYAPVERRPLMVQILNPLHYELLEYCTQNNLTCDNTLSDFMECAIRRELDYRTGEKRYSIAALMKPKEDKDGGSDREYGVLVEGKLMSTYVRTLPIGTRD